MASDAAGKNVRDKYGRFIKVSTPPLVTKSSLSSDLPPMVNLQVTNPVQYLKMLLDKILKNSEISITLKIKPAALISVALAIAILLGGTGFSIGYFLPH